MEEKQLRSMQLFRLMDRMRRAWTVFTPKPEISKSQFALCWRCDTAEKDLVRTRSAETVTRLSR